MEGTIMAFNKRGRVIVASAAAMAVANEAAKELIAEGEADPVDDFYNPNVDTVDIEYIEVRPQARHPKHKTHPKRVGKHNR